MDISSSSRLTVYHDGQFWVGLCEINDEKGYAVCRLVFGAEPSDEEVLTFVCERWTKLSFTAPTTDEAPPKPLAKNPKRRQREAAKALAKPVGSTKAQAALSAQREELKVERKSTSRERREARERSAFELRQQKRKQKHRGH